MNQKHIPIVQALQAHERKQPLSFHVPGHKYGQLQVFEQLPEFQSFLQYDVTEITGMDDFHSPEGCILEAQQLLTDLYGTRKSYFLVNGSTVGNLAMVMAVCQEGDTVLVQRNCHKSIIHALKLAKLRPVFVGTAEDERTETAGGVELETIQQAYRCYGSVKALILTYPTYYGGAASLQEIIEWAKKNGSFVLVDEAHGSHFILPKPFPESALVMGADIVVHSAHKMLPAMTMGAYLHVQSEAVPLEELEFYLQVLQSSSPSYPIMASLDIARAYLASITEADILFTVKMRDKAAALFHEKQIDTVFPDDPLKLVLRKKGYTGYELQAKLEESGIYTELADPLQVLCTFPLLKEGECEFMNQLETKLEICRLEERYMPLSSIKLPVYQEGLIELALPYELQVHCPTEWVTLQEAAGRVVAETIIPYPPGIPFIMKGERMTARQAGVLRELLTQPIHIQGGEQLSKGKLAVFSEAQSNG
ncbi:aminotransferase class I/II-fold pyridoxal phosphate-dependent enzyme [Bacillus thermotolerans]|uniref:aminotransferase class I/II-fold pyridoxal phosphate-dependent enzyme n=1 Tax=Bacillus thermotolerans TaxID=1221996 RepID=UPI00058909DD|nr:aminotransferase class I/II-fold pyridoxal phosphate-dependent enzyme [Bacillus thermotolerans]KKB42828.1 Arginine decarboxylase [Bacillus thermotolerans]